MARTEAEAGAGTEEVQGRERKIAAKGVSPMAYLVEACDARTHLDSPPRNVEGPPRCKGGAPFRLYLLSLLVLCRARLMLPAEDTPGINRVEDPQPSTRRNSPPRTLNRLSHPVGETHTPGHTVDGCE